MMGGNVSIALDGTALEGIKEYDKQENESGVKVGNILRKCLMLSFITKYLL